MTLTHIDFAVVQRSKFRNGKPGCAVKTAAYLMCGKLFRDDGAEYDFSRKKAELVQTELLLPDGAPDRFRDPQILWNACEAIERRSDSQTARQVLLTIPRECPAHLRVGLARTIAERWRAAGMGVQFAVHNPPSSDDKDEQPHIHVQLTMRTVEPTEFGLSPRKRADWNTQFFGPSRGRDERQRICDDANTFFERHDLQCRLDPRTLAEQGIDRPPEPESPRAAFESWKRTGADPTQAPAPVARVLKHRKLRRELAEIEREQTKIQASIKQYEQSISLAKARTKTELAKLKLEDAMSGSNMNRWMFQDRGLIGLSSGDRAEAERAYAAFTKRYPGIIGEHTLAAYVDAIQAPMRRMTLDENPYDAEGNLIDSYDDTPTVTRHHIWPQSGQSTDSLAHAEALAIGRYLYADIIKPHNYEYGITDGGHTAAIQIGDGRIIDDGYRLTVEGKLSPEIGNLMHQLAIAKGWRDYEMSDDPKFRATMATAKNIGSRTHGATEKPNSAETKMTRWNEASSGYSALSPDEKYLANQAFAKFTQENPEKGKTLDVRTFVDQQQRANAKTKPQETEMPARPTKAKSSRPTKRATHPAEPWMEKRGGYDALSEPLRASARESYERWLDDSGDDEQRAKREEFGLYSYCDYVQEKFAQRRAEEEKAEAAKAAAAPDAKAPSEAKKSIRAARETEESKREFSSFVHKLLSERYSVPEGLHDFVKRIDISKESGEAVLTLKSGGKIVDTGSEIRSDADVTADLAAATVATAHARGWDTLTVTGSDDYRTAIAKAAALHEPPIGTDVELPRAIQHEIQEALVERAKAALKDTGNSVAPATKTPTPAGLSAAQAQATAALDRAQARQQAELAGEPKGQVDAKALAEPRIAELQSQLETARLAAEEARLAADDHAREFPRMRRLMDQGARARHAALDAEASRLERVHGKLVSDLDTATARITKEAASEAKAAQRSHDDWRYQPSVRRAQRNIADIERLRVAVAAGNNTILEAINSGKITGAVSKLLEFESSQMQKARAARTPEQIRGQAIDRAFAEVDKSGRDPERKEMAMEATRAAVGGDAATIAALDSGKIDEALKAAAAWRKKLDDEAAALKRAKEEKETLEKRLDPPQMAMPQP